MGEKIRRGQLSYWVTLSDAAEVTDPRAQRNSSALETLPYFCTSANMKSAIVYLSQELQGLGLSCPLVEAGGQRVNLVALVNASWEVTQLYRAAARDTSTLYDQRRRDAADLNHFQSSVRELQGNVEDRERQVCDAREKERQAVSLSKTLAAKLRAEKDEVRKLSNVVQQREAHHQHEIRKKETENSRLRDRLHRMVSGERSFEVRQSGISLSSSLTRHNHSRAKWKTDSANARYEEDLQKRVLSQYESWVGQLNDENDQLRSLISLVSSQLTKMTAMYAKGETRAKSDELSTSMNSSTYSTDSLENLVVSLEFPAFKDKIQHTFDQNLKTLMQVLEERGTARRDEDVTGEVQPKKEVEKLRKQLSETKQELASYKTPESKVSQKEDGFGPSFLVDSQGVEEGVALSKAWDAVRAEKCAMQQEREKFTEATIRLNRERASFEAEKVELLKQQFLMDLPSTLSDAAKDAPQTASQDSGGSLSSGSLEAFDSPQRLLYAIPNLTPPQGNITHVQGATLPVVGPSVLPKQQQHCSYRGSSSQRIPVCRLRSAPASRASSIPRQFGIGDDEHMSSRSLWGSPQVPFSRPRTLERDKPKWHSSAVTHLNRSRSQSKGDLTREDGFGRRLFSSSCSPHRQASKTLSPPRIPVNFQDYRCTPHLAAKEAVCRICTNHQENKCSHFQPWTSPSQVSRKLMLPVSGCELYQFSGHCDEQGTGPSKSVEALEQDLVDLMDQIAQRYCETANSPSLPRSHSPPLYEEAPTSEPCPKQILSFLKTAPDSLLGSRGSSQDLGSSENSPKKTSRHTQKTSHC